MKLSTERYSPSCVSCSLLESAERPSRSQTRIDDYHSSLKKKMTAMMAQGQSSMST